MEEIIEDKRLKKKSSEALKSQIAKAEVTKCAHFTVTAQVTALLRVGRS
jgi:hypothetical protein